MKTDVNGCSTCLAGQEQYESYFLRGKRYFQYEYRSPISGVLFSVVAPTLENARMRRDRFMNGERLKEAEAESAFNNNHPELNP